MSRPRRPRHVITETEDIARALDDAAKRWPEDSGSRRKLLLRLLDEGHRAAVHQQGQRVADRRATLERAKGALTGAYGPDYLSSLRDDWPS